MQQQKIPIFIYLIFYVLFVNVNSAKVVLLRMQKSKTKQTLIVHASRNNTICCVAWPLSAHVFDIVEDDTPFSGYAVF